MDCPICDKPDIGDFTRESIVCPQCNSDLKGYLLVKRSKIATRKKLQIRSLFFGSLVIIVSTVLLIVILKRPKQVTPVAEYTVNTDVLDSLAFYRYELKNALSLLAEKDEDEIEINYIVKSSDSFSKIAYMFYGDWKHFSQIQDRNGITGSHIEPGDTLIIKIDGND